MTKEEKEKLAANPEGFVAELIQAHKAEIDKLVKAGKEDATAAKKSIEDLTAAHTKEVEELNAVLTSNEEEIEGLNEQIEQLKGENAKATGEVPGTYTAKSKKVYRFKKGVFRARIKGEIVESVDLLKDSKQMEHLISIGAGIIEEVK